VSAADADLHLELHARMELGEAAERRGQRAAGDLLDHAETRGARQPRRRQAMTSRFLELQQATRVAKQHLAIIGQRDTARCPSEQGPLGLELKPLDLLAHRRLRQVEPISGAVEPAAIGDGNEGAQQFEIQHAIDPFSINRTIISVVNNGRLPSALRTAKETHHIRHITTRR
jgi:hypothetical protein